MWPLVMPKVCLLQAHLFNIGGVLTDHFPGKPLMVYDLIGTEKPTNLRTNRGTKVYRVAYNSTVQLVLQDTAMMEWYLHGTTWESKYLWTVIVIG